MVLDAVSNFVRGTTDAAVDSSQTTVSVADASIFPDPSTEGEYNVVIWDAANFPRPDQDGDVEILRVTAIDTGTNTLTVTRAQETTAAAAHPSGSAVHLSPTAKMFSDVESTFADFWDSTAQELTADVNNQSVNTEEAQIDGGFIPTPLDENTAASTTRYSGNRIGIAAGAYQTIFDLGSPVDVIGGVINGADTGEIRITWSDSTTDTIFSAKKQGRDAGSDLISVMIVPPMRDVLKLEFLNDSGSQLIYGYSVETL